VDWFDLTNRQFCTAGDRCRRRGESEEPLRAGASRAGPLRRSDERGTAPAGINRRGARIGFTRARGGGGAALDGRDRRSLKRALSRSALPYSRVETGKGLRTR
jgi:hypothetical protein